MKALLQEAVRTSLELFRITVPISIITRLLNEWGLTELIGQLLSPVMAVVGLPGELGLVWATAMLTNLYGGMVVFAGIAPGLQITVAQITVLTTMMLIAHGLPVELRIAQKCGARLRSMLLLRVGGALILGGLLNLLYQAGNWLQQANQLFWQPSAPPTGWWPWVVGEVRTMGMIFLVILSLLALLKVLEKIGLIAWLTRCLEPLLKPLGLGPEATPMAVIGLLLGLSYGGSLLIQKARSGAIPPSDLFFALALMGLCHSLIEDTLVMMVLGGHLSGLLVGRLLFSLLVVGLLVRLAVHLPDAVRNRLLFRPVAKDN